MTVRYAEFETLRFDRPADGVLVITIDGGHRVNPISPQVHGDLSRVWNVVDADRATRVVVIRGAGGAFSAGGDVGLIEEGIRDYGSRLQLMRDGRRLVHGMLECSKPIVSAVRGPAIGGGLAVALLADVSVVSTDAELLDGHTRLGVAAGDHAAMIWPMLVGLAKAKYHLLVNEPLTGAEAERIGLVSLAVDDAEVEAAALSVARRLADGSETAISWTKLALNGWLRLGGPIFDTSLALETLGFGGPDLPEGLAAMRENRTPSFPRDGQAVVGVDRR